MSKDEKNIEILRNKISAFIDSNCGLVEVMGLKEFLDDLPYDSVSIEGIDSLRCEFEGLNGTIDFLLLNYSVEQILHLSN